VKILKIKVDDVIYTVSRSGNHYFVLVEDTEVLKLKVTVGNNLEFNWESDEGQKSYLISKIGLAIEHYDLQRYL
jgi:hypothetical protein